MAQVQPCMTCRYFQLLDAETRKGECRRSPPQVVAVIETTALGRLETAVRSFVPNVTGTFGCGEHGARRTK